MPNDSSSIELEFRDVGNRQSASEVGIYVPNRSISNEYRYALRPGDCDVFETCAEMDISRTNIDRKGTFGGKVRDCLEKAYISLIDSG